MGRHHGITRRRFLLVGALGLAGLLRGAGPAHTNAPYKAFLPLVSGGNERGLTICQQTDDCRVLGASWWHNWAMTPHLNMHQHVPFARSFGPTWDNQALTRHDLDYLPGIPIGGQMMIFNEPNVLGQGMYDLSTIGTAIRYVRDNRPDIKLGFPALLYTDTVEYGNWGYDTLLPYLTRNYELTANDAAFSCYHAYGETAAQALAALDLAMSRAEGAWPGLANKPKWVTECGFWFDGWGTNYVAELVVLMVGLRQRKIQRWAYFPAWAITDDTGQPYPLALRNANGITDMGVAYRDA